MEQEKDLLKTQQLNVLKDLFPQGHNAASASKYVESTPAPPTDHNYINMV